MAEKIKGIAVSNRLRAWLAVFACAFVLYWATCAAHVVWQDSGFLSYRVLDGDLTGIMGVALSHPLYIALGIVLDRIGGHLGYLLNVMSAFFGAITVANVYLLLRSWGLQRITAQNLPSRPVRAGTLVGTISVAVAWTFWWHCTVAEVYTLYTALMTFELLGILWFLQSGNKRWLFFAVLINGIAFSNHLWAIFGLGTIGLLGIWLLISKKINWRDVILCGALWILGASLLIYVTFEDFPQTNNWSETIRGVFFGRLWENAVLNSRVTARIAVENFLFIGLNFATPLILLLPWGLCRAVRQKKDLFGWVLALEALLYFGFAFRYTVVDRFAFFMPFYVFGGIFIGLGTMALLQRVQKPQLSWLLLALAVMPVAVYAVAPTLGRRYYPALGQRRSRPYRDEFVYYLQPFKTGYDGAYRFSKEALEAMEPGAILYADSTTMHTLMFVQQSHNIRRDVHIVSDHYQSEGSPEFNEETFKALLKQYDIYVVSPQQGYCPEFILDNYRTAPKGVIHKVLDEPASQEAEN